MTDSLLQDPARDALLADFQAISPIARVHIAASFDAHRAIIWVNKREESLCLITGPATAERVREYFGDKVVEVKCEAV